MHPHVLLIERFYEAFAKHQPQEMAACYHPDAAFQDPVFPHLQGADIGSMWNMLVTRGGKQMKIDYTHRDIAADDQEGQACWEAHYHFSQTGRKVHNVVQARFQFADGLILRHEDDFNFARWSRQALGWRGLLLGHTRFLQAKVQAQAAASLAAWKAERGLLGRPQNA